VKSLLDRIVAPGGISTLFQPIVLLRDGIAHLHSVECLTRGPKGSLFENAGLLLEYVRRKRAEVAVDRICIEAGLREFGRTPLAAGLSLNVHASTLGRDADFSAFLDRAAAQNSVSLRQVTIEIVEHTPAWHISQFLSTLDTLRGLGVRIALDDVGNGYANYRMVLDVQPNCFKIDSYLVKGCEYDRGRRALLAAVLSLGREFGSSVVVEGVETFSQMDVLRELGFTLFQGYLLGRPQPIAELANADFAHPAVPGRQLRSSQCAPRLNATFGVMAAEHLAIGSQGF
jgi:EAL domain-containing protein (putative c-di-GMP-specific phosphodiesterase class I)